MAMNNLPCSYQIFLNLEAMRLVMLLERVLHAKTHPVECMASSQRYDLLNIHT